MRTLLQVRIQYKGAKAGDMNRSVDLVGSRSDPELDLQSILLSDLQTLKVTWRPKSEHMQFIRKSGQILFSWETDKDGPLHRALDKQVRDAMKPLNRQVREDASIKYVKLETLPPPSSSENRDRRKSHDHGKYDHEDDHGHGRGTFRRSASPARSRLRATYSPRRNTGFGGTSLPNLNVVALGSTSHVDSSRERDIPALPFSTISTSPPAPFHFDAFDQKPSKSVTSIPLLPYRPYLSNPNNLTKRNYSLPDMGTPTTSMDIDPSLPSRRHAGTPTAFTPFDLTLSDLKGLQTVLDRKKTGSSLGRDQFVNSVGIPGKPTPIPIPTGFGTYLEHTLPQSNFAVKTEPDLDPTAPNTSPRSTRMDIDQPMTRMASSSSNHFSVDEYSSESAAALVPRSPASHMPTSSQSSDELTRELWDIRKQRAALVAREAYLVNVLNNGAVSSDTQPTLQSSSMTESEQLRDARAKILAAETSFQYSQKGLRSEQQKSAHESQKLAISRELNATLRTSLKESQMLLGREQQRRSTLESVVEDLEREMKTPFVVPEIFEAMMKIAEIGYFVEERVGG